ncbi:MAG: hypothetical protein FWB90_03180 [Fibromonadales bacterium]|nr:hypothetical protein [Fibromonadales bacterium]
MNKIKFFAFFAVSAIFIACGSQDGGPAELKNGGRIGTISPFDTLIAEFDSKIVNIQELSESNITYSDNATMAIPKGKDPNNKLYFIGAHGTTSGGLPYFKPGIAEGSIEFANLKNEDGYVQKKTVLYYSTHRILDGALNSTEANADDIDTFGSAKDGVTFAGSLDSLVAVTEQGNIYDVEDFFTLMLHARDTIEIKASSRDSLYVQFYKSTSSTENNKTIMVKKGAANTIKDTIGTAHLTGSDPLGTMAPFYIKVYTDRNTSRPNPYTITILRKEGKL